MSTSGGSSDLLSSPDTQRITSTLSESTSDTFNYPILLRTPQVKMHRTVLLIASIAGSVLSQTTVAPVSQITDGQPQAPTGAPVVSSSSYNNPFSIYLTETQVIPATVLGDPVAND